MEELMVWQEVDMVVIGEEVEIVVAVEELQEILEVMEVGQQLCRQLGCRRRRWWRGG